MPIPVITNFTINKTVPFDTRLVATSSEALTNMLYKYEGLTTYRTDTKLNYTYNGSTWAVSSNGIYGGSGNLGTSSTIINFGTFSTTVLNSVSKKLTFKSYTDDSGLYSLRLENYFERHGNGYSGVSYKSQFIFSENDDQGLYYGSYIMHNPIELFNSGKGGISFGVIQGVLGGQDNIELPSYERMRIDGNGIIRFKPNLIVNDSTKSLNIGVDFTDTRPFIGFNWNGIAPDSGSIASYVQFDNSVVSIHHFSGAPAASGTHSAIFSKGQVSINGALRVSGITNVGNIEFGFGSSAGGKILSNLSGIIVNSDFSASLVARKSARIGGVSSVTSLPVITYDAFSIKTNIATNIWDNNFDPAGDSYWTELSNNALEDAVVVSVSLADTTPNGSNFEDFTFTLKGLYNQDILISSWYLEPQIYDRYLYFYKEGNELPISHQVEWFLLSSDLLLDIQEPDNWVQIGKFESGDIDSVTIPPVYQTKHYAQSVIIPANMYFKINFTFYETDQDGAYTDQTFTIKTRIIRSGKF